MKKIIAVFLSLITLVSFSTFNISATDINYEVPVILDFVLTSNFDSNIATENDTRASGLIQTTALGIAKEGSNLLIEGKTFCSIEVVKCGFKDLMVQRRATGDDPWRDYYEYGNVYTDGCTAGLSTKLSVARGYQYRVTCKHYAKKSLLVTQTISNTSNIVTVS